MKQKHVQRLYFIPPELFPCVKRAGHFVLNVISAPSSSPGKNLLAVKTLHACSCWLSFCIFEVV